MGRQRPLAILLVQWPLLGAKRTLVPIRSDSVCQVKYRLSHLSLILFVRAITQSDLKYPKLEMTLVARATTVSGRLLFERRP